MTDMAKLRRILFVTHNFPPMLGGISVFSWELCKGFQNHGLDVKVLTSVSAPSPMRQEISVQNFTETPIFGKFRRLAVLNPLRRCLARWKPDVIFLASLHPYGYFVNKMAHSYGVPYVVGSHGSDIYRLLSSSTLGKFQHWIGNSTLQGASVIFSVSSHIADLVKSITSSSYDPVVIPNGVDTNLFLPGSGNRKYWSDRSGIDLEGKFVLCSVSSLQPYKGHSLVLEAIDKLKKNAPALVYLVAGQGRMEYELKNQVKRFGLSERVAFLGPVDHSDIPDLLRSSDLLVQISQPEPGEGFGIVFLEACACGLPVIGSRVGGIPDVVKDGETGFLVDPENPAEIAEAIEKLMNDEPMRRSMGQNGIQWARQHDWSLIVPKYLEALEKIVP